MCTKYISSDNAHEGVRQYIKIDRSVTDGVYIYTRGRKQTAIFNSPAYPPHKPGYLKPQVCVCVCGGGGGGTGAVLVPQAQAGEFWCNFA